MKYNKIIVSKVLELRSDLGLIIEVNEGQAGKPNDLVLWLQYKNEVGQWAYKGSNGATGIRIPITDDLESFLLEGIKKSIEASNSHKACANQASIIDVNALNALSDEQKQALLLALTSQAKAKAKQPKPKKEQQEEPELQFANELLKLIGNKKGGKNSKK